MHWEQLEAAFYTMVVANPYTGISALEMEYLTDIRNHEVAHREFFKAAITAAAPSSVIPGLEVDFLQLLLAAEKVYLILQKLLKI